MAAMLLVIVSSIPPINASAEKLPVKASDVQDDSGFRWVVAVGNPEILSGGIAYKARFGTQLEITGTGYAMGYLLGFGGQLHLSQDLFDFGKNAVYGAAALSYLSAYVPIIDCVGDDESCYTQDINGNSFVDWHFGYVGARVGVQRTLDHRRHIALEAGPHFRQCISLECPDLTQRFGVAASVRFGYEIWLRRRIRRRWGK